MAVKRKRDEGAPPESDVLEGAPHPRLATRFFGNAAAEATLLGAYRSGRLPHCWIFGGPEGIGKATLAWRFARFLFAHPDPAAPEVQEARTLSVPADHPVVARIASLGVGDLCLLRREWNAKVKPGRHFTEIRIDDVRAASNVFRLASSSGGWRISIIDSAEDLNANSANALLKLIEEPPPRSVFIFISQRPGQILPTIRSRSRLLMMQGLSQEDIASAIAGLGDDVVRSSDDVAKASAAAKGSVRHALTLLDPERLAFEQRLESVMNELPRVNWKRVHEIADRLTLISQIDFYETAIASVLDWLDARIHREAPIAALAPYARAWEKIRGLIKESEALNLDKRALMLMIFDELGRAESESAA